ncbi:PH domain-containing protein [Candidatus Allofournierella excrementavium]|uniref:PH domain-containing protein n=1 Tax=Candidatus Allofournierella excrementavium TaxID=2838591 RepID=UPI003A8B71B8
MTDLENMLFLKLRPAADHRLADLVAPLLAEGETVLQPYQGIRDGVVFTDRRVIAVNTQGFTGKKKTFVSLPCNRIQAYSVESAGMMDLDSEMQLWFAGLGVVTFEFIAGADLASLARLIGEAVLT